MLHSWLKPALALVALLGVIPGAFALDFDLAAGFPQAAPGSFGIVAAGLGDGRLVAWNGDAVFVQTSWPMFDGHWVMSANFTEIASGYKGDPGFLAVASDGHTVYLGAGAAPGHAGQIYKFDVSRPADFTSAAIRTVIPHYSGVMISPTHLLMDQVSAGGVCQLVMADMSMLTPLPVTVMEKPAVSSIGSGQFAASAPLAVAPDGTVYMMSIVYDSSTFAVVSNELRRIPAATLIDAFNAHTEIAWTDAIPVGAPNAYFSGGPAAADTLGHVYVTGFGGIQVVDGMTGEIVDAYAPHGMDYYSMAYNALTRGVFPIVGNANYALDVVYAPKGMIVSLPAATGPTLAVLAMALAAAALLLLRGKRLRADLLSR